MAARICKEEGCGRPKLARGLCQAHYRAWRRGAKVEAPLERVYTKAAHCQVKECGRHAEADGLCREHLGAEARGEEVERAPRVRRWFCTKIDNGVACERPHYALGLCAGHYTRSRRPGKKDGVPLNARRHKGGRVSVTTAVPPHVREAIREQAKRYNTTTCALASAIIEQWYERSRPLVELSEAEDGRRIKTA